MSTAAKEAQELEQWSPQGVAKLLAQCRERGCIWALRGVNSEQVYGMLPGLRAELVAREMLVVGMDPTGILHTTRTFSDVIDACVGELERRGLLNAEIEELLEWMHTSQDPLHNLSHDRETILTDTLSRLWRAMCDVMPIALFIFHPHHLTSQVSHQLGYLARYYFTDPIADLAPEISGSERSQGALVVVEDGEGTPEFLKQHVEVIPLDVTEHMEAGVREYLARPEVIRSLVETTRGDLGRLEDIVTHLDGDVHHLWMRRVEQSGEQAKLLVELLALCEEPVELGLVHRALMTLVRVERFPGVVKQLTHARLVSRMIQMGSVRLGVAEPDFASAIVARMSTAHRQKLHGALLSAARDEHAREGVSIVFIAEHAFGAGEYEVACEVGLGAARQLFGEGALQEAASLIDRLLEQECSDVSRAELHAMAADVWSRLHRWRRALRHCGYLKRYVVGVRGRAELALRTASLLSLMNRYETADQLLERALVQITRSPEHLTIIAKLYCERGEATFKLGQYNEAMGLATRSLEALSEASERGVVQAHVHDRAVLEARNLQGKVDILLGRHEQAIARFEQNMALARELGWEGEAARAEGNLGVVAMQRFDYDEAIERLERTLQFSKRSKLVPRSICLLNLALIHHFRFEYTRALSCNLEALRVARQNGIDSVYSNASQNLAMLYRDMGALERAEQMLDHLDDQGAPQRNTFVAMRMRVARANICFQRGDFEQVVSLLTLEGRSSGDDVIGAGRTERLRLALAYVELKQWTLAREIFEQYEEDPDREELNLEALHLLLKGRLLLHEGEAEQAAAAFQRAADMAERAGNFREAVRSALWRAQALLAQQEREESARVVQVVLSEIVVHASRVPVSLRAEFLSIRLHQQVVALAQELEVALPDEFAEREQPLVSPEEELPRDAAWVKWREQYSHIVGESTRLLQIFKVIDRVANSDTTMLLLGESGTGKELIAEAIHAQSARCKKPLIKVNCAAFVESLLMSELFGHEKGAFTGAMTQKIGRFEMADGGTIFLDEIADITPQTQVALLRVLQEREFERVGGTATIQADVRVVCATNKNLEEMVEEGTFRLDLYYRLKGMVIELPALRERPSDIPRLVESFSQRFGKKTYHIERAAMRELVRYSWPGNIRELQNFIKSLLLFVEEDSITLEHIQEFEDFFSGGRFEGDVEATLDGWATSKQASPPVAAVPQASDSSAPEQAPQEQVQGDPEEALVQQIVAQGLSLTRLKKRLEQECIRLALIETEGNVTQAAKILQMKRPRLSQIINADDDLTALKKELTE